MNRVVKYFNKQNLHTKFTISISIILFIPVIIMFFVLFQNMKNSLINKEIKNVEDILDKNYIEIKKTIDLCNMSTQFFEKNQDLKNFLKEIKIKNNLDIKDIISFNKNQLNDLESIVNSNPYLYQIRVYSSKDNFIEIPPILYNNKTAQKFPWYKKYVSGEWYFDYDDILREKNIINSSQHMMSLITTISDYNYGDLGILEVSVDMEQVLPILFEDKEDTWAIFIDKNNNIFYKDTEKLLIDNKENIIDLALKNNGSKYTYLDFLNKDVILGAKEIKEISGNLIYLIDMNSQINSLNKQFSISIVIILFIFILLILVINCIVKCILKRFYIVLNDIRKIEEGNIDIKFHKDYDDEIGKLAESIDKMLLSIRELMIKNINKEILMKNSEIKALQSQINAHFIYNVLESIKMMLEIEEKYEISDMVTYLGKLLRYSMKWNSKNPKIYEELEYVKNYLELMNLRFDFKISLSLDIPDIIFKQEIPKMSLQPIIENAIYHGLEELQEDSIIEINGIIQKNDFILEIKDYGIGMNLYNIEKLNSVLNEDIKDYVEINNNKHNNIGLKNINNRIKIRFGNKYGILVSSKEGQYTSVNIKLPIIYKEE